MTSAALEPVDWADPFVGTGRDEHTMPPAAYPMGVAQTDILKGGVLEFVMQATARTHYIWHNFCGGGGAMKSVWCCGLMLATGFVRARVLDHANPFIGTQETGHSVAELGGVWKAAKGHVVSAADVPARNPLFAGWYADPQIRQFGDRYWIFPTYSDAYEKQTVMDSFSSTDLKTWTKHPSVFKASDTTWVKGCLWAPDIQEKDGKYYLFFGANDAYPIDRNGGNMKPKKPEEARIGGYGGIGVAVADRPEGPYRDLLGKPLIDQFWNAAQPIDQYVFRYEGEWYMVYGGWGRCNLVHLAPNFMSLLPLEDGKMWRDVTPKDYTEGSVMFERKGMWYFMYSSGCWTGDDYCVNYSTAKSPFGPFEFKGRVLASQRPLATGAGHHSVLNPKGTDDWYICYHRRPIPNYSGHHRVTCLDKLEFTENGDIKPVVMTR